MPGRAASSPRPATPRSRCHRLRPSELRDAAIRDRPAAGRERSHAPRAAHQIASSASSSAPTRASCVTTCSAAPLPFWCCRRRAIEMLVLAPAPRRPGRARPAGRRPRAGSRTASASRPAGSRGSSRHAASFCRKPGAHRPDHARDVGDHRRRGLDAAGARAFERDLANRVALQHHGVERAVDLRERMLLVDERRLDAHVVAGRRRGARRRRDGSPCRARAPR